MVVTSVDNFIFTLISRNREYTGAKLISVQKLTINEELSIEEWNHLLVFIKICLIDSVVEADKFGIELARVLIPLGLFRHTLRLEGWISFWIHAGSQKLWGFFLLTQLKYLSWRGGVNIYYRVAIIIRNPVNWFLCYSLHHRYLVC